MEAMEDNEHYHEDADNRISSSEGDGDDLDDHIDE